MLLPLSRLLRPDSPQKWKTIKEAALADDASTRRLIKLMLVSYLPVLLVCIVVLGLAMLAALG
jgi:hypothetical protein